MRAREVTAFAVLPFVLAGIVFLPPWVYLFVVWAFSVLAVWELVVILKGRGHPVQMAPTLVATAAALPAIWLGGLARSGIVLAAVVLLLPAVYLLGRGPVEGAGAAIAGGVLSAAYFAVAGGAMGLLRTSFADSLGVKVVLLHCLTIWAGDSGAFYLGSLFGRHRLAPVVSPKKSWEGILGGTIASFIGVAVCRTLFFSELPWLLAFAIAALLSFLAPVGDLVESLFKRDGHVKDSSALIPGHGGFLDRTDSLFYAAPFVLAALLLAWKP